MLKAYKTELNPTPKQQSKIRQTIGVCRYIYNFYLAHNKEVYANENRFVSGMDFSKITKYQIFYGTLSEKIIEDMKTSYQLVILDSLYVSPAHIESLQSAGVLVYGYISLGDIESSDLYFLHKIKPGDYLMVDGKRVHSGWNDMGDIRKTHYKSLLMENIQRRIIDKGFDGVFFDTIEYYEDTSLAGGPKNSEELVAETIKIKKKADYWNEKTNQ